MQGLWELLAPVGRRVSVETLSGKRLAIGTIFSGDHLDELQCFVFDLSSLLDGIEGNLMMIL